MIVKSAGALVGALAAFALGLTGAEAAGATVVNLGTLAQTAAQSAASGLFAAQGLSGTAAGWDAYDATQARGDGNSGEAIFAVSGANLFVSEAPRDESALNRALAGVDDDHGGYMLSFATPRAFPSAPAGTLGPVNDFEFAFANPVPEPSTWGLMALGFGGLILFGWKRKRSPIAMNL